MFVGDEQIIQVLSSMLIRLFCVKRRSVINIPEGEAYFLWQNRLRTLYHRLSSDSSKWTRISNKSYDQRIREIISWSWFLSIWKYTYCTFAGSDILGWTTVWKEEYASLRMSIPIEISVLLHEKLISHVFEYFRYLSAP